MFPDKDRVDSLSYGVSVIDRELELKVTDFYMSRTAKPEYEELNLHKNSPTIGSLKITYRDKYHMMWEILIDFLHYTFEKLNQYNNKFDNSELEFIDRLGFDLSKKHMKNTGQEVTDWYGKK